MKDIEQNSIFHSDRAWKFQMIKRLQWNGCKNKKKKRANENLGNNF